MNQDEKNKLNSAITERITFLSNHNGKMFYTTEKKYTESKNKWEKAVGTDFPKFDADLTEKYQEFMNDKLDQTILKLLNDDSFVTDSPFSPFHQKISKKEINNEKYYFEGNQRIIGKEASCYWWFKYKLKGYEDSPISISVFIDFEKVQVRIENKEKESNVYSTKLIESLQENERSFTIKGKTDYASELEEIFKKAKEGYMMLTPNNTYIKLEIGKAFSEKKQIVLTGAPGTGKTHSAREYAREMVLMKHGYKPNMTEEEIEANDEVKKLLEDRIRFVQFHPSFDYTDFIEGLKPVRLQKNSNDYTFVRVDGIFKKFCRNILDNKIKDDCYFIIDEINRADLSKVFGELMYGLEESYRDKKPYPQSQYSYLPTYKIENDIASPMNDKDCFKDGFFIPENLYIIGTMNDIDRSVESFDFALRRRFKWIDVQAKNVMKDVLGNIENFKGKNISEICERINEMNKIISGELGKKLRLSSSFHIGPSYFSNMKFDGNTPLWADVFKGYIKPILLEYTRSQQGSGLQEDFIKACYNALCKEQS